MKFHKIYDNIYILQFLKSHVYITFLSITMIFFSVPNINLKNICLRHVLYIKISLLKELYEVMYNKNIFSIFLIPS